jgi:Mg2+-importing ATPase
VALDFVQEYQAQRAAERLSASVALHARVVRDGQAVDVPARDIVPGDIIILGAGDLVPADGQLVEAKDFFVNQALLTGEPYPVERTAERENDEVFMGTSAMSGTARMLVSKTGTGTALGQIAQTLATRPPPTAFEQGTRQFGLMIMKLTFALVLFVVFVNALSNRPFLESFLFAVALAVGLTPELLPMVVSVTLSKGALRMSRKNVVVKRLAAIHDLGMAAWTFSVRTRPGR